MPRLIPMKMHTLLFDLNAVLYGIPGLDAVKLTPRDGDVYIEGMVRDSAHYSIVIYGRTREPVDGLDTVSAVSSLRQVSEVLQAPHLDFATIDSHVAFGGRSTYISDMQGHNYRIEMLSTNITNQVIQVPPLRKPIVYVVHTVPTETGLECLEYWTRKLGAWSPPSTWLIPYTNKEQRLMFQHELGSIDCCEYPFAPYVSGALAPSFRYNAALSLRVMRLARETTSTVVSYSDQGLCRVRVETSVAEYDLLLPGHGN